MRAAIFQSDTPGLTPAQRLDRLREAAEGAAADVLLCPELFMSGYDAGQDILRYAEPADGPFARGVADIARATGTAIAYGYPERDGHALYNAARCIGPDGTPLANHRKQILPPGFEATCFTPGAGLTLFDLGGLRCGLLICYEIEFPEAVRATAMAGAQVVLAPTALHAQWDVVAERMIPARAFENGVYVVYANHAGSEGTFDYLGASVIIDPTGRDLVRAGPDAAVIAATLEPARVTAAQARLPYHRDLAILAPKMNGASEAPEITAICT